MKRNSKKEKKARKIINRIKPKILPTPQRRVEPRRVKVLPRHPKPHPQPKLKQSPHIIAWIVLGVGVATVAVGSLTGILAQGKMDKVTTSYNNLKSIKKFDASLISKPFLEAQSQGSLANVLFGVGGATTTTGVVMLLFWKQSKK